MSSQEFNYLRIKALEQEVKELRTKLAENNAKQIKVNYQVITN